MMALTLHHPWPWAIVRLGKPVENRNWVAPDSILKPGDWLALHGGVAPTSKKKLAELALEAQGLAVDCGLSAEYCHLGEEAILAEVLRYRGVFAAVRYAGVVEASASRWFQGPYGWTWSEKVVLPEVVACRGHQKLWPLDPRDVDMVRIQFAAAKKPRRVQA